MTHPHWRLCLILLCTTQFIALLDFSITPSGVLPAGVAGRVDIWGAMQVACVAIILPGKNIHSGVVR